MQIYVKTGYKQRVDDIKGVLDKVVYDTPIGTLLEIDESVSGAKKHYKEWTISNEEEIKAIQHAYLSLVPSQLTARQLRLQLLRMGLLEQAKKLVESSEEAKIEWEYARDIEITSPLLQSMAKALGLDEIGMANFFKEASKL